MDDGPRERQFTVAARNGALVRAGAELSTPELVTLPKGTRVFVVQGETTTLANGAVRFRLRGFQKLGVDEEHELDGWCSAKVLAGL